LSVAERAQPDIHVEARGIGKRYGGVAALDAVSVRVRRGEIHGLCGENGAGKSTLGKVVAGSVQPEIGRASCRERV